MATINSLLDYSIDESLGFNDIERIFIAKSLDLMMEAISEDGPFKERALANYLREGGENKAKRLLAYNLVFSGSDSSFRVQDEVLNFFLKPFYEVSRTIGVTYWVNNQYKIRVNRYYLHKWMKDPLGMAYFAGHLFHEYLHCLGFKHRWSHKGTLVYEWGYLVRELATEIIRARAKKSEGPAEPGL